MLNESQSQLIGIARGLMRQPPLLLFDDIASSHTLHEGGVKKILKCLDNVVGVRIGQDTTIIVSQQLIAISSADKIIVLINGRIVEQGTHYELMDNQGWYATNWILEREKDEERERREREQESVKSI